MALLQQPQQQAQPQQAGPDPKMQGEKYKSLVTQIGRFLYSEQGTNMVAEAFRSGAPIQEVIPMIVSRVFESLFKSAKQAGKSLPPDMMVLAMIEITQAVLEMAEAAGAIQEGEGDSMGQDVFMEAASQLDRQVGSQMDEGEYSAYQQIFNMFGGQQ